MWLKASWSQPHPDPCSPARGGYTPPPMAFTCTIVTPENQPFDGSVTQVILPAHDGQLGILTNHSPLLVKLGAGSLQIDTQGNKAAYYYVEGGVAQMLDNKLTVLTHTAIPSAEITAESARAELASAESLPSEGKAALEKKTAAIRRAQGKLAIVGK